MSNAPFMQLYVGDYLADTTHLSTEQHGAYLLLLMTMWRHGGSLPNDAKKLARICNTTPRRWPAIWSGVEEFFSDDGERITNARLTKEHQKATAKSELRATAGALGGKAKALKANDPSLANATVLPKHGQKSEPELKKEDTNVSLQVSPANAVSEAVSIYNDAASRTGWPSVQKMTPNRSKQIRGRLADCGGVDGWRCAVERAEQSDFLSGRTDRPWAGFGFDWLVKSANFTKLMEGNYDNRTQQNNRQPTNGRQDGPDAAFEQALRLAGISGT